jgi:outer membrane murein-binding lipoprotein Lpp
MFRPRLNHIAATASVLLAGTWACAAQQPDVSELQAMVQDLRTKNADLERSLVQANRNEKEASEKLARVEQRLAALGRNLLDGGDDRLVQATSDLQVMSARVTTLEGASSRLAATIADYVRQAVAADPDARLRVETAIRELDEVLGLRQKPAPTASGTAGQAKVVSIDAESGLLVLNVGESQNARIGTAYRLVRGEQQLGTAIIADVRRNVCGAFVEQLDPAAGPVRLGDTAILITQPSR